MKFIILLSLLFYLVARPRGVPVERKLNQVIDQDLFFQMHYGRGK